MIHTELNEIIGLLGDGPKSDKHVHYGLKRPESDPGWWSNTLWLLDHGVRIGYFELISDNKDGERVYGLTPFKGRWLAHVGNKLAA